MKKKIQSFFTTVAVIGFGAALAYFPKFADLICELLGYGLCVAVFVMLWAMIHSAFFSEKESNDDDYDCIR